MTKKKTKPAVSFLLTDSPLNLPSCVSTWVVGMTVAVGVGVGTGAGVIMGLMLALGVGLFPGLTGCLLAVATTGVGLMLAVGGSEVLALTETSIRISHCSLDLKDPLRK